ncbi:hypothetical protein, partial [Pseudomonas aeruginosa]
DRPPPFHPWKLFFKAYPTKSLSLPLYPTIFSLYPSGLSHSLSGGVLSLVDLLHGRPSTLLRKGLLGLGWLALVAWLGLLFYLQRLYGLTF